MQYKKKSNNKISNEAEKVWKTERETEDREKENSEIIGKVKSWRQS